MPTDKIHVDPQSFADFGAMMRYLRRRARLTQYDLSIAVGYSTGHINRFEKGKRIPDPAAVAALFVPALDLDHEPQLAARLIELATLAQKSPAAEKGSTPSFETTISLEPIPPAAPNEIARTRILDHVRARLDQTNRVALCGLPGVGKTVLASDLARAEKNPVFWLTLTEDVTTSVDALVSRLAAFLISHGQDQVQPLAAMNTRAKISLDQQIALIASALGKQTALLCFDNAELFLRDPALLQIMQHLSTTAPARMLFTTRESLPISNVAEISVRGFENDEGMNFVASNSSSALDAHQAQRLIEKTEANPMLLQLALGQFFDQRVDAETFIARLESQPQVAAYLLRTIQNQLSPGAWRLVLLLSVFQQPIHLYDPYLIELMHAHGGIENADEAIAELQRRRLIDDAAFARLHPLVRDYVYLTLNTHPSLRQRLHRLAGDWFADTNKDVIAAAMHYNRAGLADQALDLIEENESAIVERGLALSAVAMLDEAHTQIKRARTEQTDERRRLLTMRGILLRGTLRVAEGEANLREAMTLTQNPSVRANIIIQLCRVLVTRSRFQDVLQLVQIARTDLAPNDLVLQARLYSLESNCYNTLGNPEASERAAQQSLSLANQMIGLPVSLVGEIRAQAEYDLAGDARYRRNLTEAMNHAQAALTFAREAKQARLTNVCLMFIGGLFYDLGDLDASFSYRQDALTNLLAMGDSYIAAYTLAHLADIHHLRLEEDAALEKLERANEIFRIIGDTRGLASAESARTTCLLWLNRIDEARAVIEKTVQELEGKGTEQMWGYRLNKLAIVQLVQGETDAAITTLHRALALPTTQTKPMMRFELHGTLAFAHAIANDYTQAMRVLADAPHLEGLSRWVEFDRTLSESYVALARGEVDTARALATQVLASAEIFPLYRQNAKQLLGAIACALPTNEFPKLLWVGQK